MKIRDDVVERFMGCEDEGVCPVCGEGVEPCDSDEGTSSDHFLIRFYECQGCGTSFYEEFKCVPVGIVVG